ncbi:MAG: LysR family transcriptional regulator [Proteobacteria bacterium]|nr:LysR family transcriptional regulator [Pseudomonadota bacterium]
MFNYNHLYYFYITAKSGSTTVAASHLRISQPSLSSQLGVLEDFLKVKLFRKVGRNNQLTESGAIVYGYCRRMFDISEELSELILEQHPTSVRKLSLGVSNEVKRSFAVDVVSAFMKKHGLTQRPKVTMISGTHEQLVSRLRLREIDIMISQFGMSDPELTSLMRTEVPVMLVASTKTKFYTKALNVKSAQSIRDLFGNDLVQWVLPSASFKLRADIDRFIEHNEIKGRIVFESDVMDSLIRSVGDEIGVAFLPQLYVDKEIKGKQIRVLGPKEGFWKYRVWMGCHNQNREDPLVVALAESFKRVCDNR